MIREYVDEALEDISKQQVVFAFRQEFKELLKKYKASVDYLKIYIGDFELIIRPMEDEE